MSILHKWAAASRGWPVWLRYLTTTLVILAVFVFLSASPRGDADLHLIFFLPIVLFAGAMFNRGNGLYATALSSLFLLFLLPPVGVPAIESPKDAWALIVFVLLGIAISIVVEALHMGLVALSIEHEVALSAAHDRQVLLNELAHRTRNDLVNLATLLTLQARAARGDVADALTTAVERVRAVARVHRTLSLSSDRVVVDSKTYIDELCEDIRHSLALLPVRIDWSAESHQLALGKAVPIGLILNEAVTNAVKHAFVGERPGTIQIQFIRVDANYEMTVSDNGVGLAAVPREGSLGRRLITLLAAQLGGEASIEPVEGGGTCVRVIIPRQFGPASQTPR